MTQDISCHIESIVGKNIAFSFLLKNCCMSITNSIGIHKMSGNHFSVAFHQKVLASEALGLHDTVYFLWYRHGYRGENYLASFEASNLKCHTELHEKF